jgi:acetyl-CoA carboxylase/biotin carboxylase 1
MHRLDAELLTLDASLENATPDQIAEIKVAIAKRENTLLPLYMQIAHEFADLHDRAGRMKAKGVIRDALNWKRSREFFYWRANRRIFELELRKQVMGDGSTMSFEDATKSMQVNFPRKSTSHESQLPSKVNFPRKSTRPIPETRRPLPLSETTNPDPRTLNPEP